MRRGDLTAARQTLARVQTTIDDTLAIVGDRQAILADLVYAHSRLIDAALPYPEFDEITLKLSNKRTELLRKLMSDKETPDTVDLMFWTIMERAQLHLLRSEWEQAEQDLLSATDYLHSNSLLPRLEAAKASLQAHQHLLEQARSSTASIAAAEKVNLPELLNLVKSPCVLVRLRLSLAERRDIESLERLSHYLWDCSEEFYRKTVCHRLFTNCG